MIRALGRLGAAAAGRAVHASLRFVAPATMRSQRAVGSAFMSTGILDDKTIKTLQDLGLSVPVCTPRDVLVWAP
jgi:hypothetical protein